jgi:hypothetical protein
MRTPLVRSGLVALLVGACASASPKQGARPAGAPGPVAPPPARATDAPIPPPPGPDELEVERSRRARAEEALKRTPTIEAGLAKLRAQAFKTAVAAEYQTADAFRAFVKTEVARELPPEKAEAMSTAFHHVGLLPEKIDLGETIADALVTQAAAYYDPRQKKFFVVMVPELDMMLDMFTAHELTHALQDQHHDLVKYLEPAGTLENDVINARRYIVEGEATVTMFAYALAPLAGGDPMTHKSIWPMLRGQLADGSKLTLDEMTAMSKQQASGIVGGDEDLAKSAAAMDRIPLVILVPLMESYLKGTQPVVAAFEHGGWAEVDRLYATPPDSTEQVLHPTTKLFPKRDVPKQVTLPELPGYTEVHTNVMGELEWRVYFMVWDKAVAEEAAAGWDGDRWRVVKAQDGTLVGLLVSTWDSAAEAKQFAKAYEATIAKRFPDKSRRVWVKTKGAHVYIVDGGTDPKLIDTLVKKATIK